MKKYTIALSLALFSVPVLAEEKLLVGADAGYGEYLAGECVGCHKIQGASEGIPSITGWDAETFATVIHAYKNKELENPVMQLIAGRLEDDQIASLAVYFASLPAQE